MYPIFDNLISHLIEPFYHKCDDDLLPFILAYDANNRITYIRIDPDLPSAAIRQRLLDVKTIWYIFASEGWSITRPTEEVANYHYGDATTSSDRTEILSLIYSSRYTTISRLYKVHREPAAPRTLSRLPDFPVTKSRYANLLCDTEREP